MPSITGIITGVKVLLLIGVAGVIAYLCWRIHSDSAALKADQKANAVMHEAVTDSKADAAASAQTVTVIQQQDQANDVANVTKTQEDSARTAAVATTEAKVDDAKTGLNKLAVAARGVFDAERAERGSGN